MPDYQPNIVLSNPDETYRVVGTRPVRHDGPDKVMGRARYAADIHLPEMLHGKILRSPHAHARIRGIDASRALARPGVHAVVTSADFPAVSAEIKDQEEGATVNYGFYSRNVMAREKALYRGHAVAAIAADSPHLAEEALALIDVDYEVLTPALTAAAAMAPGAPIIHERLVTPVQPGAAFRRLGRRRNWRRLQCFQPFPVHPGRPGSRLRRSRRHRRTGIPHPPGASGLH